MTDADALTPVETRLRDLAGAVEFPPTPALRSAVISRLRATTPARRPSWSSWRRGLLFAATAAAVLLAVALAVAPVRDTLAGWLGLRGVTIQHVPGPVTPGPSPTPAPSPSATPAGPGASLDLGSLTTLDAAPARLAFRSLVPAGLGPPDAVWLREPPPGGALSLVYLPAKGRPPEAPQTGVSTLVTEFRGDLDPTFLGKVVGSGATVQDVRVGADAGFWIAGAPHGVIFRDPAGQVRDDTLRLATNTLIWQHGTLILRIEAAQTLEQALAMAASLR